MAKPCQGLNSKCFLIAYLVIVGFLLILWLNRLPLLHEDNRDIPVALQSYLTSPPRLVPMVNIKYNDEWVLTSEIFNDKWTLVYFTHTRCFPHCDKTLTKMLEFQDAYASHDVKLLIIDLDTAATQDQLRRSLHDNHVDIPVVHGNATTIESLAKTFVALFLTTKLTDGTYQIEQENKLFLVDPKARVYATFEEQMSSIMINQTFSKLRAFYARSE